MDAGHPGDILHHLGPPRCCPDGVLEDEEATCMMLSDAQLQAELEVLESRLERGLYVGCVLARIAQAHPCAKRPAHWARY